MTEPTLPEPVPIDASNPATAARLVRIQHAAYAVEADLIGFHGIPPLHDTAEGVMRHDLRWLGVYHATVLTAAIGYTVAAHRVDIDRLMVDPVHGRRGMGAALVTSASAGRHTTVSTGSRNLPAIALYESLGFEPVATREIAPGVEVTSFELEASDTVGPPADR